MLVVSPSVEAIGAVEVVARIALAVQIMNVMKVRPRWNQKTKRVKHVQCQVEVKVEQHDAGLEAVVDWVEVEQHDVGLEAVVDWVEVVNFVEVKQHTVVDQEEVVVVSLKMVVCRATMVGMKHEVVEEVVMSYREEVVEVDLEEVVMSYREEVVMSDLEEVVYHMELEVRFHYLPCLSRLQNLIKYG